jgi:hypothetical protein
MFLVSCALDHHSESKHLETFCCIFFSLKTHECRAWSETCPVTARSLGKEDPAGLESGVLGEKSVGSLGGSTWGLDSTHGYAQRGKHREAMVTSFGKYFGTGEDR